MRISKLLRFTELIFAKLIENHTHAPSVVTSWVQSLRKFSFCEICEVYTPRKQPAIWQVSLKVKIIHKKEHYNIIWLLILSIPLQGRHTPLINCVLKHVRIYSIWLLVLSILLQVRRTLCVVCPTATRPGELSPGPSLRSASTCIYCTYMYVCTGIMYRTQQV